MTVIDRPAIHPPAAARPSKRFISPVPAEGENDVYTEGWFAIAMSDEVPIGKVVGKEFLDGRVVAYRGEDGVARVTSAYCPHLGADLRAGCVVGNNVQCAFHKFEYDSGGKCVKTGYDAPPPPTARLYVFPTVERYGLIWAWNGDGEPKWPLPDFAYPDDELYFIVQEYGEFPTDPFVPCCNTPDYHHFKTVHGLDWDPKLDPDPKRTFRWTDHSFEFDIKGKHWNDTDMDFTFGIYGVSTYFQQGTLNDKWYGYLAPFRILGPQRTLTYFVIAVRKGDGSPEALAEAEKWANDMMQLEIEFVNQDIPLLDGIHFVQGTLTKKDEPLAMFLDMVRGLPRSHPSRDFIN